MHITATDTKTFRKLQAILASKKIDFHTFTHSTDRTLKVIVKGIPPSYLEDEVKSELEIKGYEINSVRQFAKDGRKLPIFMITLPCSLEPKRIFDLGSIFYISVNVEPYKNNAPAQCHTCQKFEHSSFNCGYPPKCVKCDKDHLSSTCTKDKNLPAKCSNCDGDHTANYHKCPKYMEAALEKVKSFLLLKRTHAQSLPPFFTPNTETIMSQIRNTPTYAQKLSSQNQIQPSVTILTRHFMKILSDAIKEVAKTNDIKQTLLATLSAIISLLIHNG